MASDPAGDAARRPTRLPNAPREGAQRDLRLFFAGQTVSLAGTWMQSVAQGWLVWRLTRSAEMLGLVNFLGAVPVFLFGIWAGSIADRHPRRHVVLATQSNAILQAALLAAKNERLADAHGAGRAHDVASSASASPKPAGAASSSSAPSPWNCSS